MLDRLIKKWLKTFTLENLLLKWSSLIIPLTIILNEDGHEAIDETLVHNILFKLYGREKVINNNKHL